MKFSKILSMLVAVSAIGGAVTVFANGGQGLRNVKLGEPVPRFQLTTSEAKTIDSEAFKGDVLVLVYLSAEQRNSERAAVEAERVVEKLAHDDVELLFATADMAHESYFAKLWEESALDAQLGYDPGRDLYGKLGLVVFPTTLVIGREGRLSHVISTRGADYRNVLDAYLRHTLGTIDDAGLERRLTARSFERSSPKALALRHRTAARLLRDKGLMAAAERELRAALELEGGNVSILLDLADLLLATERASESMPVIDRVMELSPDHHRGRLLKGIALFQAGRLDEAERVLRETLVLNPDPARTHYYLGRVGEAKGNKDAALEHYRQALSRLLGE